MLILLPTTALLTLTSLRLTNHHHIKALGEHCSPVAVYKEIRMNTRFFRRLALAFTPLYLAGASGCSLLSGDSPVWEPTEYTLEELMELALDNSALGSGAQDEDYTDDALEAYNIMLGYAENEAGVSEYKIYDFYYVHFDSHQSYVIKIVMDDEIQSAENDPELDVGDERIVTLTCDPDGSDVSSCIETHLMAKRWRSDLADEFSDSFPDYHTNFWYNSLDYFDTKVAGKNYTDRSDYTYYLEDDFYAQGGHEFYDISVNVIVPVGTDQSQAGTIFEEIKPLLRKYCVTDVQMLAPLDEEAYQLILSEEEITGNHYVGDATNAWLEKFTIVE